MKSIEFTVNLKKHGPCFCVVEFNELARLPENLALRLKEIECAGAQGPIDLVAAEEKQILSFASNLILKQGDL